MQFFNDIHELKCGQAEEKLEAGGDEKLIFNFIWLQNQANRGHRAKFRDCPGHLAIMLKNYQNPHAREQLANFQKDLQPYSNGEEG